MLRLLLWGNPGTDGTFSNASPQSLDRRTWENLGEPENLGQTGRFQSSTTEPGDASSLPVLPFFASRLNVGELPVCPAS